MNVNFLLEPVIHQIGDIVLIHFIRIVLHILIIIIIRPKMEFICCPYAQYIRLPSTVIKSRLKWNKLLNSWRKTCWNQKKRPHRLIGRTLLDMSVWKNLFWWLWYLKRLLVNESSVKSNTTTMDSDFYLSTFVCHHALFGMSWMVKVLLVESISRYVFHYFNFIVDL